MKLLIDQREKSESLIELVVDRCDVAGIPWERTTLTVGDFAWVNDEGQHVAVIEHKSVNDYIGSIRSCKLQSQLADLKENGFPYIALFIDGKWNIGFSGKFAKPFTRSQKYGSLLAITMRDKIPVLEFPDELAMVEQLMNVPNIIDRKTGIDDGIVERGTHAAAKGNPNLAAYLHLKGCGLPKARELVETYGPFIMLLAKYRAARLELEDKKITKKAFDERFPKALLNKTTRKSLDAICFAPGEITGN